MRSVKKDFPILSRKINGKKLAYLDNAATSQKPRQVINAITDYYQNSNANVHRGVHALSQEASEMYEEARKKVAQFIGAEEDELIFVRNTSEGLNMIAFSWAEKNIDKGEEIVTTIAEHHSNFLPWQRVAKKTGAKLIVTGVNEAGEIKIEEMIKAITNKTKLVAVTQMSNTTGEIVDLEPIIKKTRKVGAVVVIDGAQSVPHLKVDVKKLKCDFLVFSGHKMLAPMGIGGVYAKRERQAEMEPYMVGGGMISEVGLSEAKWAEGVEKWEAGTPNVAGAVGLAAAVDYLSKLGMDKVRKHEQELTKYALGQLKSIKWLKIVGPKSVEKRGGVISFTSDKAHAHDIAQILDSEGVAVRSGHHCTMPLHKCLGLVSTTRASFYVYNDKSDVDQLIKALGKVEKILF